jgi:hypothetical protein
VQQDASSAQQQTASSAQQQGVSSAQQQADSSAQQQQYSSAVQQDASSAQQQTASSAQQQGVSSAQQQSVSSAQQQQYSSAVQQDASSAQQQTASSAQQQGVSSAQQQGVSSAQQQQASSAIRETALEVPRQLLSFIKTELTPLRKSVTVALDTLYSPGGDTDENKAALQQQLGALTSKQAELARVGSTLFSIDSNYQDPELQTPVVDRRLSAIGVKKVFDLLRNTFLYIDSNNKIIDNPLITPVQKGGNSGRRFLFKPRS